MQQHNKGRGRCVCVSVWVRVCVCVCSSGIISEYLTQQQWRHEAFGCEEGSHWSELPCLSLWSSLSFERKKRRKENLTANMIDINEVVWLHHAAWGVGEGMRTEKKKKKKSPSRLPFVSVKSMNPRGEVKGQSDIIPPFALLCNSSQPTFPWACLRWIATHGRFCFLTDKTTCQNRADRLTDYSCNMWRRRLIRTLRSLTEHLPDWHVTDTAGSLLTHELIHTSTGTTGSCSTMPTMGKSHFMRLIRLRD